MQIYEQYLLENKAWAQETREKEPEFFSRLSAAQSPEILWIGCSGSRVSPEIIVNALPGELFVHRNIANQVLTTDFNCLSVVQYAVEVLKVKHIVVCGHYHCRSVTSALIRQSPNLLMFNKWLNPIRDLYRLHQSELESLPNQRDRVHRLVELNVIEQVNNLAQTSIIQSRWRSDDRPSLHGWVYDQNDGILHEQVYLPSGSPIAEIYQYEDAF